MKAKKKPSLPVDIKLPERVLLDDGTLFVTLRTLDELERFWREHQGQFEFACEGKGWDKPFYLREYEWVFGTSKSAVVRTVLRWGESGVGCEFYDWSKSDRAMHACWFHDRDEYRDSQIEKSLWSDEDEKAYQADCIRRSPETYRGWWQFKNIPGGCDPLDWFNPCIHHEELFDPNMPIAEVEKALQEQTFDDWKESDVGEIEYHDRASIGKAISYWRNEKAIGQDYYGCENECAVLGNVAAIEGAS